MSGLKGKIAVILAAFASMFVFASCESMFFGGNVSGGDGDGGFDIPPGLTLLGNSTGFNYKIRNSDPRPDDYDLYYIEGETGDIDEIISNGECAIGVSGNGTISSAVKGKYYSAVLVANKEGLDAGFSEVKQIKAGNQNAEEKLPGEDDHGGGGKGDPIDMTGKSSKKGVSYDGGSPFTTAQTELLNSSQNGSSVSWVYNWGSSMAANVETDLADNDIIYVPMQWGWVNETAIRDFLDDHPDTEYILACNEPNLGPNEWGQGGQFNQTPQRYATDPNGWPKLVEVAEEYDLKIISPAMCHGNVIPPNFADPIEWLDEFKRIIGSEQFDKIYAISVHSYMNWPSAIKNFLDEFKKYDKPIWLTEWCAWEDNNDFQYTYGGSLGGSASQKWYNTQMWNMSQLVSYMEQDPMIERYAWFIARGENNKVPYNSLFDGNELSGLGQVYLNMSTCDPDTVYEIGEQIKAELYNANNASEYIDRLGESWENNEIPMCRPSTDGGVLDLFEFRAGAWVEYKFKAEEARDYTLTLRNQTSQNTELDIYLEGEKVEDVNLNSSSWNTRSGIPLANLAEGTYTLRIYVQSGNCALNWLQID